MQRALEFQPLDSDIECATPISIREASKCKYLKYKPYVMVIGALIMFLGVAWHGVFGSYLPYFASIMTRKNIDISSHNNSYISDQYNSYSDSISWTYSIWVAVYSCCMPIGGQIEHKYGPKLVLIIGSFMILLGLISLYFVIEYTQSVLLIYLCYGVMLGCGCGLLFTTPYLIGMRWFEHANKKGLISGIIMSGIAWSGSILNLLVTQFVNPENLKIDKDIGFIREQSVLDNISTSFLKFAAICSVLYSIGILLLENPPNYNANDRKYSVYDDKLEKQVTGVVEVRNKLIEKGESDSDDFDIFEILKEWKFWNIFLTIGVLPITYVYSQWKEFNNKYLGIENDQMLSVMNATSAIADGLSRFVWGYVWDKLLFQNRNSYKICMGLVACTLIAFIASWTQLKYIENDTLLVAMAFVWLIVLYIAMSGALMLLPVHVAHVYGTQKGGIVYGMTYMSRIFGTLFSMTVVIQTRQALGWFYMNNFWVCTQIIVLVLVMTSNVKCKCKS